MPPSANTSESDPLDAIDDAGDLRETPIAVERINDFVFMVTGLSNIYLVKTNEGEVLIDTGYTDNVRFTADDPEGEEVLSELIAFYKSLSADMQKDIGLFLLPLDNPKENALIVNALQRCSRIVVQNSIQEGFGLTATEAMWKQTPVLVSGAAGLKFQVADEETGKINEDPTDIPGLAKTLEYMINHPKELDKWAFSAQSRVVEHFTLFSQIQAWLKLFNLLVKE